MSDPIYKYMSGATFIPPTSVTISGDPGKVTVDAVGNLYVAIIRSAGAGSSVVRIALRSRTDDFRKCHYLPASCIARCSNWCF